MLLSCQLRISKWMYTLYFPECQVTLGLKRRDNWSLTDHKGIRTHNHLVLKIKLSYLAYLGKWLSCAVNLYLYGALDCMLLSCQLRISEWMDTLYFPECQVTLPQKRRYIWSLIDCKETRSHILLVRKQIDNLAPNMRDISSLSYHIGTRPHNYLVHK